MMRSNGFPDRRIQPATELIAPDEQLQLEDELISLSNGLKTYVVKQTGPGICRLDIVVPAGIAYQRAPLAANFTARMLKEGTSFQSGEQIAEKLDFFGSYLEVNAERDRSTISLYAPKRFLPELFPLLSEIWTAASFPEDVLSVEKMHQKQDYLLNDRRVAWVARQEFNRALFGMDHPYGIIPQASDYEEVTQQQLKEHYERSYLQSDAYMILSGDVDDSVLSLLGDTLGNIQLKSTINSPFGRAGTPSPKAKQIFVYRPSAVQSAIRVGRVLFSRTHPDFMGMQFVVSLLGGYFGSRLMKNIREDKGYTYGIGAFIQAYEHSGIFVISSEVGRDVTQAAMDEIWNELRVLREVEVSKVELERVKNYLLGSIQRALDGSIAKAERLRGLIDSGESRDYFVRLKHKFLSMNAADVLNLSQKYFQEDAFTQLVVGDNSPAK